MSRHTTFNTRCMACGGTGMVEICKQGSPIPVNAPTGLNVAMTVFASTVWTICQVCNGLQIPLRGSNTGF